jgi:hypothetical protein
MTVFQDLAAEEQATLMAALFAGPVVVSAASPGRKEETASEGFEAAAYVLDSRDRLVGNVLVSSIIVALEQRVRAEQPFPDYLKAVAAPEAAATALDMLRSAAAIVDARATPDDAAGAKRWLLEIAEVAAGAGKEDQGFLGRGGVLVNDRERAALAKVAEALGIAG